MKRILFILVFIITTVAIFSIDKKTPERPSNVPDDAKWVNDCWEYEARNDYTSDYYISWYKNGNLRSMSYFTDDKKYKIWEYYYENGTISERKHRVQRKFFIDKHKGKGISHCYNSAGKIINYYENGNVKDEICYTYTVKNKNELQDVLCGTEIHYDENGKEIKRIEHNVDCDYGCEDSPRFTVEQVIAKIKPNVDSAKIEKYKKLPVVGKVKSINSKPKEIEVSYNEGFTLSIGDEVCCLAEGAKIDFECISNTDGTGKYRLKADKEKKFASISSNMEVRFYKKNEIKNEYFTKQKSKPKAGDIQVVGGIEFVYIPSGEAMLYDPNKPDQKRLTKVGAFWMSRYEVTLGEFLKYSYEEDQPLPKNGSNGTFNSTLPVDIDFHYEYGDYYCMWFSEKYGVKARLPQPDEWEYAARAGTDTDLYWGSEKADDYCWYKKNSGNKLHPVGGKKPNAFGLYDINGNAFEWCKLFENQQQQKGAFKLYIRGGSCRDSLNDLKYNKIYTYLYIPEYSEYAGISSPFEKIAKQGTGFRIAISDPGQ